MIRRPALRRPLAGIRMGLLAATLAGVCGCSAGKGVYHRVESGQTAYRIALAYGMGAEELLRANGIADPRELRAGQWLWIPGATRERRVPPPAGDLRDERSRLAGKTLSMPIPGTISSGFGKRNGRMHDGIDILAPEGTEVRAAGYGIVLYAGDGMRGYGNAVVLDHGDEVTTLYGHLKSIRVRSGDAVAAGGLIGTVGRTGNATTTHLHFELRLGGEGVDPEKYLERTEPYR